MLYFDNAATGGRKPDRVLTAVKGAIEISANAGRSGHKLAVSFANKVQDCRNLLSEYFDGYGFDRVIFTKNCTESLNLALLGVLKKGDHVITTCLEHNSVLRPLEFLKTHGIIEYSVCPLEDGKIRAETFSKLIRPNTRMAVVTLASNVTGYTPPVYELKRVLPPDVLLVCDGAQAGGHIPVSMRKMGIDALALAGHKGLHAIQGIGALLFSKRLTPAPLLFGGTGSLSRSLTMPDFYPDALEAGTLAFPAVLSLLEGVRFLQAHRAKIAHTLTEFTGKLINELRALKAYTVYSIPNPCGIVAFAHNDKPSEQLADILSSDYGFALRGGLHCAPLMHENLQTIESGLLRASFSHFNNAQEIDRLLLALRDIS